MNNAEIVREYVKNRLDDLQKLRDADRKAALAKLRRAVGKPAGSVSEVWDYIYNDLPDDINVEIRKSYDENKPSFPEVAIQTSLSLYAMHSQGKESMHSKNECSLGKAVGRLSRKNPLNEKGIKHRFDALATAKTPDELIYHARGIIQLLKQSSVKLNYARFAKDLYLIQSGGDTTKQVQRQWGMDYFNGADDNDDDA